MPIRVVVAAVTIGTLLNLQISVGHAQAFPVVSNVTATVFDETGAVIPDGELVFRSDSDAIVSHTGTNGSVTVSLQYGRYTVTITKLGFVKTVIRDVQVPTPEAIRVVLKVAPSPINGPIIDVGPTTTASDLPNVIGPEANHGLGNTTKKCSQPTHTSERNSIYICELLSRPEHYANRVVTVRGRYVGGEIDTPSTLFGDECRSRSVEVADPEDLKRDSNLENRQYPDSANEKQNRRIFYSLGERMCPGTYVGDFMPVEGSFTGVLLVKKGFHVGKDGTGNGFGFRGQARMIFVIHSVANTCRVNDCPSPWP